MNIKTLAFMLLQCFKRPFSIYLGYQQQTTFILYLQAMHLNDT